MSEFFKVSDFPISAVEQVEVEVVPDGPKRMETLLTVKLEHQDVRAFICNIMDRQNLQQVYTVVEDGIKVWASALPQIQGALSAYGHLATTVGKALLPKSKDSPNRQIEPLREAHIMLAERYIEMMIGDESRGKRNHGEMKKFARQIVNDAYVWPVDKVARWIGYLQRYMIEKKMTTVEKERLYSRPLFHEAYVVNGVAIPETVNLSDDLGVKHEREESSSSNSTA
jgi:hypothetical protein